MQDFYKTLRAGDHLVSQRFGYTHHGIYVGNQQVIHYSGFSKGPWAGPIEIVSLATFTQGKPTHVSASSYFLYSRAEAVIRAYSRLGEDDYRLFSNNCEHFVNWCIMGMPISLQVYLLPTYAACRIGTVFSW